MKLILIILNFLKGLFIKSEPPKNRFRFGALAKLEQKTIKVNRYPLQPWLKIFLKWTIGLYWLTCLFQALEDVYKFCYQQVSKTNLRKVVTLCLLFMLCLPLAIYANGGHGEFSWTTIIWICIVLFVLGYLLIATEEFTKIDKVFPALVLFGVLWAIIAMYHIPVFEIDLDKQILEVANIKDVLLHHFGKTGEILWFLAGAMTIVEIIDKFDGFKIIKKWITTNKRFLFLVIMCSLGFILSAIIDNLTATIVLISILRKVMRDKNDIIWYASMIVLAANAGGAWSPIGDVTTTMLWIGGKVTTGALVTQVTFPSIINIVIPLVIVYFFFPIFRGTFERTDEEEEEDETNQYAGKMLAIGLLGIIFVPIFKGLTHLPPYVGMLLSLGVIGFIAEYYSNREFDLSHANLDSLDNNEEKKKPSLIHHVTSKIEMSSLFFFLGILMAVAALESIAVLFTAANELNHAVPNQDIVVMLMGILSAIIDNVPLVAASLGMFADPVNSKIWHFIAYAAGTGGSMLIIGSAAGVVAMGMAGIKFGWYLRKISLLALSGYIGGAFWFMGSHGTLSTFLSDMSHYIVMGKWYILAFIILIVVRYVYIRSK